MPVAHTAKEPTELLAFLFAQWPEVKKTKVRQWLKYGQVTVNNRATTRFDHALRRGDVVAIRTEKAVRADAAVPAGLRICYEDAALLIVEKPPNLLSIASEAEREETAYAHLTEYLRRKNTRVRERVWIVHRLDRETSGLMVFAKTQEAKHALQQQWDRAEKRYLAVVEGAPPKDEGRVVSHLDETNPYRVRSRPPSEETREARTRYRVIKRGASRTLVELTLETGRRHQIRVHLADLRCPVVGDEKYGSPGGSAKRLALHSCALRLRHPESGAELSFESPLPKDLARLV